MVLRWRRVTLEACLGFLIWRQWSRIPHITRLLGILKDSVVDCLCVFLSLGHGHSINMSLLNQTRRGGCGTGGPSFGFSTWGGSCRLLCGSGTSCWVEWLAPQVWGLNLCFWVTEFQWIPKLQVVGLTGKMADRLNLELNLNSCDPCNLGCWPPQWSGVPQWAGWLIGRQAN